MLEENIVKLTCKELGITQKELAERMNVSEGTVNRWSSKPDEIPPQSTKMFDLLIENQILKSKTEKINTIFTLIKEIQQS